MSLGKLPGMKGLVSGSQGKRRFKSDLSVDMISPPLGDFRHTMHVGRGGDVFGDTSFLSNYGGTGEPGSPDSANSSKSAGFFTRTFRQVRRNPARPRAGSRDLSSPPPDVSPIIKNAFSLPQLNVDSPNGCRQRMWFPSSLSSADDSLCTYGLQSGFVTLPRPPRHDRQCQDGDAGTALTRSDSLASFTVDLGPSLMAEVLSLIDNPVCLQTSNHGQAACEEQGGGEDWDETGMATPPSPPVDRDTRGEACSSDRTKPDEDRPFPRESPQRVELVMEAERFQRAADVLSRHYGGSSFTRTGSSPTSPVSFSSRKPSYALSEEEEEVKV